MTNAPRKEPQRLRGWGNIDNPEASARVTASRAYAAARSTPGAARAAESPPLGKVRGRPGAASVAQFNEKTREMAQVIENGLGQVRNDNWLRRTGA